MISFYRTVVCDHEAVVDVVLALDLLEWLVRIVVLGGVTLALVASHPGGKGGQHEQSDLRIKK